MKLGKWLFVLFFVLFVISSAFAFFYSEEIVSFINNKQDERENSLQYRYVELPYKEQVYVDNGKIFILNKSDFKAVDYSGKELYKRKLDHDKFRMIGVNGYIFLIDDSTNSTDVLDHENHLIFEEASYNHINSIKNIGKDIVIFSDDGLNFETAIYDDYMEEEISFMSKDAAVDLIKVKDGIKIFSLRRDSGGLSAVFGLLNEKKEINLILELEGYVPIKFYVDGKADILVTDREALLTRGGVVEKKLSYNNFMGFEKLKDNYIILADGNYTIVDNNFNIIDSGEVKGLDNIVQSNDHAYIYGGREIKKIGDDGLIEEIKTEHDIERIHISNGLIVEFRNGFLIYN